VRPKVGCECEVGVFCHQVVRELDCWCFSGRSICVGTMVLKQLRMLQAQNDYWGFSFENNLSVPNYNRFSRVPSA
jgi:hypothetical protein